MASRQVINFSILYQALNIGPSAYRIVVVVINQGTRTNWTINPKRDLVTGTLYLLELLLKTVFDRIHT